MLGNVKARRLRGNGGKLAADFEWCLRFWIKTFVLRKSTRQKNVDATFRRARRRCPGVCGLQRAQMIAAHPE